MSKQSNAPERHDGAILIPEGVFDELGISSVQFAEAVATTPGEIKPVPASPHYYSDVEVYLDGGHTHSFSGARVVTTGLAVEVRRAASCVDDIPGHRGETTVAVYPIEMVHFVRTGYADEPL